MIYCCAKQANQVTNAADIMVAKGELDLLKTYQMFTL